MTTAPFTPSIPTWHELTNFLDSLGKHRLATMIRTELTASVVEAASAPAHARKLPEGVWVEKFEHGWYPCKDRNESGKFRVLLRDKWWSEPRSDWVGRAGHPTESAALAAYWKWHDEQPENAKAADLLAKSASATTDMMIQRLVDEARSVQRCLGGFPIEPSKPTEPGVFVKPTYAPQPAPYTEATRWDSKFVQYRIRGGVVEVIGLITRKKSMWEPSCTHLSADSLLSAEQRGEVVRVGEEVDNDKKALAEAMERTIERSGIGVKVSETQHPPGGYRAGFDAGLAKAEATIADLQRKVTHWKANHAQLNEANRMLRDRPDLGDRAKSIASLQSQLAAEREAVRVLGDYVAAELEELKHGESKRAWTRECGRLVDANPIARAAIERARKEAGQ